MRVINLSVCAILWAIVAWRAPGAFRHKEKRVLWVAFFVLSVEMCFANDPAILWLDGAIGVHGFAALLKHASAVSAAACVLVFLSRAAASSAPAARQGRLRPGTVVPLVTLAAMVVLFFQADRPQEAIDPLTAYPEDPWLLSYTLLWTTYFGWAMFTASRLSWQWSRRPGPDSLRRGLRLICLGTGIGIAYTVHRASMLVAGRLELHPLSAGTEQLLNRLLALVPLLLISAGSTMPMVPVAVRAARQHYRLVRLYPLWAHLSDAVPQIRYGTSRHPVADALDPRGVRDRLYRRTIEIRDAILVLNGAATVPMRLRAADHVEDADLTGISATAAAEACWLRAAREAQVSGHARTGHLEAPVHSGADLDTEADLLLTLSNVYFSDLATAFARAHLARLTSPAGATP
ncbi:MAB_1171c family putative transporter [Kitasatospora phosalacinea]|uniref:MAB_1171c family putative transporter n=1 Tax=Kitasatospora phosalacinea TaxID=2065 RepID=UPI0035E1DE3E